jgi:hypothetical protein
MTHIFETLQMTVKELRKNSEEATGQMRLKQANKWLNND